MHSPADHRAERHARSFARSQQPVRDLQIERLMAEGYVAQQIAMILRKPVSDVRLAMTIIRKEAACQKPEH
jgi:hypothetical protein